MGKQKIAEQVTLHLKPKTAEKFWTIIESAGCEKNAAGIVAYVLNEEAPNKSTVLKTILEYKRDHPDAYEAIRKNAAGITSSILQRAFKNLRF